jgi:chromosome partitioning protein
VHPFFSMVDGRKSVHAEVQADLRRRTWTILNATVPASSAVERMGVTRTPIVVSAPSSGPAKAYQALWLELAGLLDP